MRNVGSVLSLLLLAVGRLLGLADPTAEYQIQKGAPDTYTISVNNKDGTKDFNGMVVIGAYKDDTLVPGVYMLFGLSNGSPVGVEGPEQKQSNWSFILPNQLPLTTPVPEFVDALYYSSNGSDNDLKKGEQKTFYFAVASYKAEQKQGLELRLISTDGSQVKLKAVFKPGQ